VDKFDRVFQLHNILATRRTAIPLENLMARLECSKATVHRTINTLKDYLAAPIEFDAQAGGYRYQPSAPHTAYELPGLWFAPAELQALAVIQRLLASLSPGLLEQHLAPISKRLNELIAHKRLNLTEAAVRIRLPAIGARSAGPAFQTVVSATLQRRKLWLQYHSRSTNEHTDRTVSPQRVTYYRESWFLDAWDESREALRTFSIDRIDMPSVLEARAVDVPEDELDRHFTTGYGIFGGKADKWAVLRFTPERARWVADEQWHPDQQGQFLANGYYELRIPYDDARELVMDILRHGSEVQVLGPETLRNAVVQQLDRALQQYSRTFCG
jgi:proteasome accessory factor C